MLVRCLPVNQMRKGRAAANYASAIGYDWDPTMRRNVVVFRGRDDDFQPKLMPSIRKAQLPTFCRGCGMNSRRNVRVMVMVRKHNDDVWR